MEVEEWVVTTRKDTERGTYTFGYKEETVRYGLAISGRPAHKHTLKREATGTTTKTSSDCSRLCTRYVVILVLNTDNT